MNFSEFCERGYPVFLSMSMAYFLIIGTIIIRYAIVSRTNPEKENQKKFFINELLIGIIFICLALSYPILFDNITPNFSIKAQFTFHLWDSMTVGSIIWIILIPIWRKQNQTRKNVVTENQWKKDIIDKFQDNFKTDFIRKLSHFLYALLLLVFHFVFISVPFEGWDGYTSAAFMEIDFLIIFLWVLIPFELLRLMKFDYLGKFAQDMGKISVYPDELNTFTSAIPLLLSVFPFIYFGQPFLYAAVLIGTLSDSAASIVGKRFGKERKSRILKSNNKKTLEGYIAGFFCTYIVVVLTNTLVPFQNITSFGVHILAFSAAVAFTIVDYKAKVITDNILNSIVTGSVLISVWLCLYDQT